MVPKASDPELKTVGRAAGELGVAASTLRHWEAEGLIRPAARTQSGYRLYGPAELERLRFILSAQQVGFRLDDIRRLLALDDDCPACRAEVRRLLEQRLEAIDAKLRQLRRIRAVLGRALERCRNSNGGCAVLRMLRPERS